MDRALVLVALAAAAAAVVLAGRGWAARRAGRLRATPAAVLWRALEAVPDGRATVVAFSTPSCAACHHAQKPALAALERQTGGLVRIIQVDATAQPGAARAFGVLTVPATVVLGADGAVRAANQGFASTARLAGQLAVESRL